jgi:DNA polymerase-1
MISYLTFKDPTVAKPVAILVAARDMDETALREHYVTPLVAEGILEEDIIAFNLEHERGKTTVAKARNYLDKLKPIMDSAGVETIMVCDGNYFKALTKATKSEAFLSYRMDTIWDEQDAFYSPGFRQIFYSPETTDKIQLAIRGLAAHRAGQAGLFEEEILRNPQYPKSIKGIRAALRSLMDYDVLTCDIETFDLQVDKARLGTIGFAWNQHEGIAFPVDYGGPNGQVIRTWLQDFFEAFAAKGGKLIYHGGTFDIKILIWECFMESPEDLDGMLWGLEVMFTLFEDTKTLVYLATNNTTKNTLGLKPNAFEYVGNYAIDITDITQHPVKDVLKYNLLDCCATWYVYNKFRNQVRQEQESVYQEVFLPSLKTITQMELVGLPMNIGQVLLAQNKLDDVRQTAIDGLYNSEIIVYFTDFLRELEAEKANRNLKKLVKTKDDFLDLEFNPNSGPQLVLLLYQVLELPVINKTAKKNPSTDAKTLKALRAHEAAKKKPRTEVLEILDHLRHYAEVNILLNTFIPAFLDKSVEKDGWRFLLGNFNMGGTKSGRLSSSDPNLQNIPSTGTKFAKIIKKCFAAPPPLPGDPYGWLFCGADYASLEDRVSALLTKDPNKLKVYTDGFDGHCLRAYGYFAAQMPDITAELTNATDAAHTASIINSIEQRYPELRQASKGPTFALTYMGTWRTLIKSFGIPKKEAQQIEKNYHKLYAVSDEWVRLQIEIAQSQGYAELAFGLRIRTPMLPKVVLSSYDTLPYEAYKEVKTTANALGQSYGLINSHSGNMFMQRVWEHPKYRSWILPCAQIHDAQYHLVRNHLGCLKWYNDNLVDCMEWADLDPIRHPTVGLGSGVEIYAPDWANVINLPNRASMAQIKETLNAR